MTGTRENLVLAQREFEMAAELLPESPLSPAMASWTYWWQGFRVPVADAAAAQPPSLSAFQYASTRCDYCHIQHGGASGTLPINDDNSPQAQVARMTNGYEPQDFIVGPRDVSCGWIVAALIGIGMIII